MTTTLRTREIMIHIDVADDAFSCPKEREWYIRLARWVLAEENCPSAQISVSFVDNTTIHLLNRRYLNHDYPTDVITFPLSADPLEAEIVIGREYAQQPAQQAGWTIAEEIALYLVHGLLHLLDYDDHADDERERMHARQHELLMQYLNQWGRPQAELSHGNGASSQSVSSVGRS